MAAPLEFKRRVRLPEPLEEEQPARRRSLVAPLGILTWTVTVGLAVAIAEGVVPIDRWLHVEAPPVVAALRERIAPIAEPPPAPPALLAMTASIDEPEREAAEVVDEPEEPESSEPVAEPEPREPLPEPSIEPEAPAPAPPPLAAARPEPARGAEPAEPRPKPEAPSSTAAAGKSCEQAAAEAVQSIEIGRSSGPADLGREDYSRVLDRGGYFEHCGAPETVRIDICAAVQNGRAVGVTVRTTPGMSNVASCIARSVRGLSFPNHPRLDVVRTTFEAN